MTPNPQCPNCDKEAAKKYPPWDERFLGWFLLEIFFIVLIVISSFYGSIGITIAVVLSFGLLVVELKRPKKYHCAVCEEEFIFPKPKDTQT